MQLSAMPRQPAFTPHELTAISRVWEQFPLRDRALFTLMMNSGLRITEGLRLRLSNVWDGSNVRPAIAAGRRPAPNGRRPGKKPVCPRVIPINDALRPVLSDYVGALVAAGKAKRDRPLFMSRMKRPLSRRMATLRLREILLAAGLTQRIGYGWHSARRSFAVAIFNVTAQDAVVTSRTLGNSSLQITMDYLPTLDDAGAAAVLALAQPDPRISAATR